MRNELDFCDIRIACFDEKSNMKTIPAHKVVLSACSSVLKQILKAMGANDNCGGKGPLIFLRGISYKEIEAVLDFMYNGQTKIDHEQLDAFLAAAEELKVRGLTQSTSEVPSRKRSVSNAEGIKRDKSKKAKPNVDAPGPSSSSSDQVVVKSEKMNEEDQINVNDTLEEENFQDYGDADIEGYDDGSFQDDGTGANFPTDSKGNILFYYKI